MVPYLLVLAFFREAGVPPPASPPFLRGRPSPRRSRPPWAKLVRRRGAEKRVRARADDHRDVVQVEFVAAQLGEEPVERVNWGLLRLLLRKCVPERLGERGCEFRGLSRLSLFFAFAL